MTDSIAAKPQTVLQQQLSQIWADVLSLEEVGTTDIFFEVGGDSIGLLQVLHKIRAAGLAKLLAKDFYSDPTVGGLAQLIEASDDGEVDSNSFVQAD